MKRIIIFLTIVYLFSAVVVWALLTKNTDTNITITNELNALKVELASTKTALETDKTFLIALEKKIVDARANATFLYLALCPTLEATNEDAPCVRNNVEWFSQTVLSGTVLTDPATKAKMETLLMALGSKKRPTSKQIYEMLRPIEKESIRALTESLK